MHRTFHAVRRAEWRSMIQAADEVVQSRSTLHYPFFLPPSRVLEPAAQDLASMLFTLEPLTRELQRPAVLSDGSHNVLGRAGGDVSFDLKRNRDVCSNQAC